MLYPALLYPAYTPDLLATEFEHCWLHRPLHGGSIAEIDRVCFIVPAVCAWNQFYIAAQSTALPMGSHPIEPTDWSFQCFPRSDCGTNGSWITTTSQPGTALVELEIGWSDLNTAAGTYDWTNLDRGST